MNKESEIFKNLIQDETLFCMDLLCELDDICQKICDEKFKQETYKEFHHKLQLHIHKLCSPQKCEFWQWRMLKNKMKNDSMEITGFMHKDLCEKMAKECVPIFNESLKTKEWLENASYGHIH